jgi:hypothetical protein
MGQIQSAFEEQPRCKVMSKEQVFQRTLQFVNLRKASLTLSRIESLLNSNDTVKNISSLLINLNIVIPDIENGTPSKDTLTIFQPQERTIIYNDGTSGKKLYTVLHQYNDFLKTEYGILIRNQDKINRINIIMKNLDYVASNVMEELMKMCSPEIPVISMKNSVLPPIQTREDNLSKTIFELTQKAINTRHTDVEETKKTIQEIKSLAPEMAPEVLKSINEGVMTPFIKSLSN